MIYSLPAISKVMSGLSRVSKVNEAVSLAFNSEFLSSVRLYDPSLTLHLSRTHNVGVILHILYKVPNLEPKRSVPYFWF